MKLFNKHLAVLMIALISLVQPIFSRNFYVSSSYTGATSNGGLTTPWKSISNVQSNFGLIQSGDSVLFKRDDGFSGTMVIQNKTGIVFGAYGVGDNPLFWGNGATISQMFYCKGSSNIQFLDWNISDTTISATDRTIPAKIRIVFQFEFNSTNITVRNCRMDRIGYGAYITISSSGITLDKCDIGNLRMIKNTPTAINPDDDYGGVPVQISSSNNRITNSYFHDCWAQSFDYGFDGGGVEFYEEGVPVENNYIAYNTFYDCNGTFEHGSNSDGIANNPIQNNVFAYNKVINCESLFYINNRGQYLCYVSNLQFYNNVIIQTNNTRGGTRLGSIATLENRLGMVVLKNNVFQISNGAAVVRSGMFTAGQMEHKNNVYKLSNGSVLNFTLDPSEVMTSAVLWNNTTNANPSLWDLEPVNNSMLIDFGTPVAQPVDIRGNSINGNPDAGVIEKIAQLTSPLQATGSFTSIKCNGDSSTVTIAATGGRSPYQGVGNFRVVAGTRSFIVTDAAGNKDTVQLIIAQPAVLNQSLTTGTIIVNGGTTSITSTATGGTSPYTYALNNGAYQSSNIFSNVASGSYSVVLKDVNGCLKSSSISISQPAALLSINISAGSIACNGGSTSVVVSAAGGTAPYTGTGTFSVTAGTYSYTVTDANGVSKSGSVTVAQPAVLNQSLNSGTIIVTGGTTSITSTATGGTSPYTYALNNGAYQSSNIFSNVVAGSHSIVVKDSKGCTKSTNISISQPAALLNININAGSISCNGGSTIVAVTATGGTAPYTGAGNFTVTAGTYSYTVRDANGVSKSGSVTIAQPALLALALNAPVITQNGGNTSITASTTGGTAPYVFSLNGGAYQSSNVFAGVLAGSHSVIVKDAKGCIKTSSINIAQPTASLNININSGSITCFGGTTVVDVLATGGVAPYTGTGTFVVGAGTYTYTVRDANGITNSASISITQPRAIQLNATAGVIQQYNGTSNVTLTANGGTSPYLYSINNSALQSSNTYSSLPAGTYTFKVIDNNECLGYDTIQIQPYQIQPIAIQLSADSILCHNGTAAVRVIATGGVAPYQGIGTFQLGAGTHQFIITDALGTQTTATIHLGQPSAIVASAQVAGPVTVAGGTTSVIVTANGGTGNYQYSLDGATAQTSNSLQVGVGAHAIQVIDANGCAASVAFNVELYIPLSFGAINVMNASCLGNNDGSIQVNGINGTSPYTYAINGGVYSSTAYFGGLLAGTYRISMKDALGAIVDTNIVVADGSIACVSGRIDNTTTLATNAYPNPSSSQFYVKAITTSSNRVRIEVTNFNGTVVHRDNGSAGQTFVFGSNFTSGVYFVRMIQDHKVVVTKLIKL
jgi:hypothetical protein